MDLHFENILKELKKTHKNYPDLRFGEVLQNSIDRLKGIHNVNINEKSSKEIYTALVEFNALTKKKREKVNKVVVEDNIDTVEVKYSGSKK